MIERAQELRCENITFAYGNAPPAVRDITATFAPGIFYGILGPNACGKTTFLDLLIGSKQPAAGSVTLNGVSLSDIPRRKLAQCMTLVPQEYDTRFGYTVEEIVLMGRHPHMARFASPSATDLQVVKEALADLDITSLRHRQISSLSGGQKQRVVVARAMAQQCGILLFDEATSSLDISHTLSIFSLVRKLVAVGQTVIAVIHDLNLAAAYCDQILFIKDGRLQYAGKTADVLTTKNIAEIYAVQSEIVQGPPLRVHFYYGS
jgi:iron complex transport system ATP-binding protein